MAETARRVALGKLGRPHGIRGEIRLFLFNPQSTALRSGMQAWLACDDRPPVEVEIESARYADKFVIVKFADIDDRDVVDEYKHGHLEIDYDDLPDLEEEQFYHLELVGAPVYVAEEEHGDLPEDAEPIGRVDRIFATGANDVLVVDVDDGDELMAPLVEHAVSLLDFERLLVILQPLEIWTPADDEGDEE